MKALRVSLLLFVGLGIALNGQEPVPAVAVPPNAGPQRSPEDLEQLLAPIALYPDALLAIVLPATTAPTDIVLAARYLRDNPGDRSQIEHRAWDESVKSLTSYPEVVLWLDDNLSWTQQVGEAFALQSADVMQAVQRLRTKARAAGTLVDTPQQQVIAEADVIRIVPSQPDIIYVPHYEPDIVFVDRPVYYSSYYSRPFLTFGVGVAVGSWLAFDCDWRRNTIWIGNRHRHWQHHDWHRPVVPIAPGYRSSPIAEVRQWRPPPQPVRPIVASNRFRTEIARPAPLGVTTSRTYTSTPRPYAFSDRDRDRNWDGRRDRDRDSGRNPITGPAPATPPAAALPRPRTDFAGPRVQNAPTTPPPNVVTPPSGSLPVTTPKLQPLPQDRRPDRTPRPADNTNNDNSPRNRGFRGGRTDSSPTPNATVVPAPPSSSPQVQAPAPSFNRGGVPRSFPRENSPPPRSEPAPRSAPPPAVSNPAPAPAPANTAPAAPPPQGGESRGHRGNYRRDDR